MEKGNGKTLASMLEGHEGEMFWCPMFGAVKLASVSGAHDAYPLKLSNKDGLAFGLTADGKWNEGGERVLFPSRDVREWCRWKGSLPMTFGGMMETDFPGKREWLRKQAMEKAMLLIDVCYGGFPSREEMEDCSVRKYEVYLLPDGTPQVRVAWFCPPECGAVAFKRFIGARGFLSREENIRLVKEALGWGSVG